MSSVFYHSDWHFDHAFVAGLRGYSTPEEHDEVLIERINSVVTKRDQLWVLGDLAGGSVTKCLELCARVNGTKHLVVGNHDAAHPMHKRSHTQQRRYLEAFASVSLHEQHNIGGQFVNLSHLPYTGDHFPGDRFEQWRLRDEGKWLICGHVHREWYQAGRQINVGVDWHPFPVPVDEIAAIIGGKP